MTNLADVAVMNNKWRKHKDNNIAHIFESTSKLLCTKTFPHSIIGWRDYTPVLSYNYARGGWQYYDVCKDCLLKLV